MTSSVQTDSLLDGVQINQLLQNWGTWRDAGDWAGLRSCYTADATMVTTWYDGPASGFIDSSEQMRAKQPKDRGGHHVIGGTTSQVKGNRATAETRITLLLRAMLDGKLVDVTVYGRFYDFLLKTEGQWRIQRREPIYDKDSIQPVAQGETLSLDAQKLAGFPYGFRHLAYVQSADGAKITVRIPEPYSDEEKAVYAGGKTWLEGASA